MDLNELNERFENLLQQSQEIKDFLQYLNLREKTTLERVAIRSIIEYKLFEEPRPATK